MSLCTKGDACHTAAFEIVQAEQWHPGLVLLGKALQGSTAQRQDVGRKAVEACMTMLQVRGLGLLQHMQCQGTYLMESQSSLLAAVICTVAYADYEAVAENGWCTEHGVRLQLLLRCVGITCHFCRQKKLCGEEECQRCAKRDVEQDCIGKVWTCLLTCYSMCTRPYSAGGCIAILLRLSTQHMFLSQNHGAGQQV